MSDPTSESEAVASPAAVAGLVAEVESLRNDVRLENVAYHDVRRERDEAEQKLGAVGALADEWEAAEEYRSAGSYPEATSYADGRTHQREIDADALRAVLGPVSGAVEGGLSAQSVQANVAEALSRSGVVEGAGDEFSHPCAACESDDKACEDSPAGCCDSCRSTGGCTHTPPVAGHEQEVRAEGEYGFTYVGPNGVTRTEWGYEREPVPDSDGEIEVNLDEWVTPTSIVRRRLCATVVLRDLTARASGSSAPVQGGAE